MDKDELLAKEKEFIRLGKEGKSVEDIVQALELPLDVVNEWISKLDKVLLDDILEQQKRLASTLTVASINAGIKMARIALAIPFIGLLGRNKFIEAVTEALKKSDYKLAAGSSEDTFHDPHAKAALPFALKRIQIEGYNGIIHVAVENIPVDTQWIFLTGENGYGKTTFLQAIAIGFLGFEDGDRVLVDDLKVRISLEFKNDGQNTMHHLWIPFEPMRHLAAYGSARLEIQNAQSQSRVEEQTTTSYSLFNTNGVLQNIEFELYKWYLKGDKKFNAVRKLFKQLIPQLHDIKVDKERDEVLYIEKDGNGKAFEAVPFKKLASGFRSIIAMTGDILIRLYKQHPGVTDPQKLRGIVLIDELDLHLHPKWQRELPVLLSTAFPLVQFIASTHSVIPFLGAPPQSVFLKVTRDRKKGIQVEKLDIDIKNLLPNTILTSALFDMDNITQRNHDDLAAVRTEDSFDEVLENDEVQKRLKQFEESDADFPADLFKKP